MRESRQRSGFTWQGATVAGIALLTAVLVGCAATPTGAPRVMQPGDFMMLAGPWTGSAHVQQARRAERADEVHVTAVIPGGS